MLKDTIARLSAINLNQWFDEVILENEKEILDMNRDQMYEDGVLNVEQPKIERYSPLTVRAKKRAPYNRTDHITLKWFGNFHKSLRIIIFAKKFIITSKDKVWDKYLEPQDRFTNALGLTKENKDKLRDIVLTGITKRMRNVI